MIQKQFLTIALLALLLASCGNATAAPATAQAVPTFTPDPCIGTALADSIKPINDLQREFDDASNLASNLPQEQLDDAITNLQRIRRAAEDVKPPACLSVLQRHQLAHMNAVIDTLLAFVGGANTETLNQGLAKAREEHDQYSVEMARLLGITLVPSTNTP